MRILRKENRDPGPSLAGLGGTSVEAREDRRAVWVSGGGGFVADVGRVNSGSGGVGRFEDRRVVWVSGGGGFVADVGRVSSGSGSGDNDGFWFVNDFWFLDFAMDGGGRVTEKLEKAEILYNAIDGSNGFYMCPVEKSVRSLMNVPFTLEKSELEAEFIKEADKENMVQLKGHRLVWGMRASIYNAMPLAGVDKLVAFMKDFQARHA
ncbi:hypothetical protein CMV_014901 [Castanea mollissima]|uniref:phosphoserine transaminase n=1 Tax=Castanea mollissima TaxID=60419 RepID=A0A8J4VTZ0_9ROSI|nr:hypothetical protein CMV_014901 [Castanea mollissima]